MLSSGWVLALSATINAIHGPIGVQLEISPGEKALLDKGVITEQDLATAYREAIERGSFKHYNITGGP